MGSPPVHVQAGKCWTPARRAIIIPLLAVWHRGQPETGGPSKRWSKGIPRAAHRRQLPASQPKALMVDVSGRPTALRGVARRQSSPTAGPLVRSSASKLKQQKCPADRQTRATRAPRIASHRITPQRQSLSHRPLSFHRSLRGCSLPGTGTHHCEARRSTCCMHQ